MTTRASVVQRPPSNVEKDRAIRDGRSRTREFELEWLLLDLEEQICAAMQATSIARSELAERLGTSRAFVTKLLSGHANLTLRTLVRVANALDVDIDLRLRPRRVDGRRQATVRPAMRAPVKPRAPVSKSAGRKAASAAARSRKERTTR
ncbi:MAG: helix-turn-helix transcriptional regulator [Chloroflexota bacterium]|nr:helix-turn-helix transcriptional regulator [Chloroflexota bacterium]